MLGSLLAACGTPPPTASSSVGYVAVLPETTSGCVDVASADGQHWSTGKSAVHASVGQWVIVILPLSAEYVTETFPWSTPVSSNPSVLQPKSECPNKAVYSLPEMRTGFRAATAGTATIRAKLRPAWSPPPGAPALPPYVVTVEVS